MTGDYRKPGQKSNGVDALRIVVADDDSRMREFYMTVLGALGHEVVAAAADGEQLVADCVALRPDLVISDIRMPGLDGLSAAAKTLSRIDLPFIFVSAYHYPDLIDRASRLSSYGYLVKPIKARDLETAIPLAIKRYRESN